MHEVKRSNEPDARAIHAHWPQLQKLEASEQLINGDSGT